jgi:CheY-like chemotaxis protein
VLSRAFEPFFTTKAIGRGSGLGLSMVYGFVTQSGGRLDIDSEPGRGTRVALFLPVAAAGDATAPADMAVPELHGTEEVLVVEDEPEVRHVAAAFLRALGYRVVAVGTAAEALEQLARHEGFALLFTDVMLGGGMNGIELAHAARSLRPGLAVLLASGYDEPALLGNAAPGAFALLRKPYRREQLAASVRSSLRA